MRTIARLVMKLCGLIVALGLLGLVVSAISEPFGGLYSGADWPAPFNQDAQGNLTGGTFWEYMWQVGVVVIGCAILGSLLWFWVGEPDDFE